MNKFTLLLSALTIVAMPSFAMARHGADDPAGHVRGEGPGHASLINGTATDPSLQIARRGRGADDPKGHVRHGRGKDDPVGHA